MGDNVVITRVKRYNVEEFMSHRRRRMLGALALSVIFVCGMVAVVFGFLGGWL